MILAELVKKEGFTQLTNIDLEAIEISGLYYGDLLSFVMANGKENYGWVTVQTHVNIIAVASLINFSCIIVPESISVDQSTINKAETIGIPVISSKLDSFEIFNNYKETEEQ